MSEIETRAIAPKWLTKTYLKSVLEKRYPTLEIDSFTATPPIAAGNNYASLILRVQVQCKVNGVEEKISVIVKTLHYDDISVEVLSGFNTHDNEMKMYSEHLTKYQNLLKSLADDDDKLAPEVIFVDNVEKAIIFEDLKESNYKLANRKLGLDFDHMKIIIRKLAKLHACSIVLQEHGETFSNFDRPLINGETDGFNAYFVFMCREMAEDVLNWSGYEKYGEKILKLADQIIENGIEVYKKKPVQTLVLNHGDSWVNNMMFKYDENGQVYDAALIDFQLSFVGSPIFDLSYFFHTSACDEIKFGRHSFVKIVKVYHHHLTAALKTLKSTTKPPTLFELNQEFHQRSFIQVINAIVFPVMVNENEKDAEIANLVCDTETARSFRKNDLLRNERVISTVKHFLPLWDAEGLLDPLK